MTEIDVVDKPVMNINDTTNLIAPVKATPDLLKQMIFPADELQVNKISYHVPTREEMYGNDLN